MTSVRTCGRWAVAAVLAMVVGGCPEPAPSPDEPVATPTLQDPQRQFDSLCAQAKQMTMDQSDEVYREFGKAAEAVADPDTAMELFRFYTARTTTWRAVVVDEINPFDMARAALGERLAEFKSPQSPQLLVDLLTDMQLDLRGAIKDALGRALTGMGPAAMPFLRTVPVTHQRRAFADELIADIKAGKVYTPDN